MGSASGQDVNPRADNASNHSASGQDVTPHADNASNHSASGQVVSPHADNASNHSGGSHHHQERQNGNPEHIIGVNDVIKQIPENQDAIVAQDQNVPNGNNADASSSGEADAANDASSSEEGQANNDVPPVKEAQVAQSQKNSQRRDVE